MYIIPGHSGHAQIYKNAKGTKGKAQEAAFSTPISPKVDFGASIFPKGKQNPRSEVEEKPDSCYTEVMLIPRWWAEASVAKKVVYWQEHDQGGHFASWENPTVLLQDIREFTKKVRPSYIAELIRAGKLKV